MPRSQPRWRDGERGGGGAPAERGHVDDAVPRGGDEVGGGEGEKRWRGGEGDCHAGGRGAKKRGGARGIVPRVGPVVHGHRFGAGDDGQQPAAGRDGGVRRLHRGGGHGRWVVGRDVGTGASPYKAGAQPRCTYTDAGREHHTGSSDGWRVRVVGGGVTRFKTSTDTRLFLS